MALTILITLTSAGIDLGDFNLLSNVDGYTTPFETGITRGQLLAGYTSVVVPDSTETIRVQSVGTCINALDIGIVFPTTTTTTTAAPTTTTTTTAAPTTTTTTTAALPSQVTGGISTNHTVGLDCGLTVDLDASFDLANPGQLSIGDQVYSDLNWTTPFVGNGDYYRVHLNGVVVDEFSIIINASGIVGSPIAIC